MSGTCRIYGDADTGYTIARGEEIMSGLTADNIAELFLESGDQLAKLGPEKHRAAMRAALDLALPSPF